MGNTIFGANTADPAYEIGNSLRLNDGDSTYLKKTVGDGNRRKWTLSMWLKKSTIINNTEMYMWASDATGAGGIHDGAGFYSFGSVTGDNTSNSFHHQLGDAHGRIIASAHARDVSAWYHMVWNVDTANSTAADRMKLFVNGSRITDQVVSQTNPDQNFDTEWNRNSTENYLFADHNYTRYYFDGYVADVAFVDGQAYDASYFGKTNNQGIWVPIEPDVSSWGTNGFFLEFKQTGTSANSSGIGADTSGNDNHWTPVNLGARNVVQDTPTNNFLTWNPLYTNSRGTFAEGNCQVETNVQGSTAYGQVEFGNMHLDAGKWYWEVEVVTVGSGGSLGLGMSSRAYSNTYTNGHNNAGSSGNVRYSNSNGEILMGNAGSLGTGATYTNGDTIMFAMDLDNSKFYTGKNGTWNNSQDPANGTNAFTLAEQSDYGDFWTPWISKDDTTHNSKVYLNTGNPVIANDSGNADGNGYGDFEYAVPSGFYAMCTKNIAQYG